MIDKVKSAPDLVSAIRHLLDIIPIEYDYHGGVLDKELDAAIVEVETALADYE